MIRKFFARAFLAVTVAFAFVSTGCLGEKTPPDMPKLYPTTITLTQDGQPCVEASVQLLKKDDLNYKWLAGGVSDETGKCVIKTMGKFNGAPEGDFTVVVYKTVRTESETRKTTPTPADPAEAQKWAQKVAEEEKEYDYVDTKYKSVSTSDLTISIKSGKNEETIELGPAVQVENKQTRTK